MSDWNNPINQLSSSITHHTRVMKEEALNDRIFQLELALAQESDPSKIAYLTQLYNEYVDEYNRIQSRRFWGNVFGILLLFIVIIGGLIFWKTYSSQSEHKSGDQVLRSASSFSAQKRENDINVNVRKNNEENAVSSNNTQNNTQEEISNGIIINEFLGTWTGSNGYEEVEMTFYPEGQVVVNKGNEQKIINVKSMIQVGADTYRWVTDGENEAYLAPTMQGGIGGVNVRYAFGVRYEGNRIQPLIWSARGQENFNFSNISTSGLPSLYRKD